MQQVDQILARLDGPVCRGGEHDPAGYNLYRIDGSPGAWTCVVERRAMTAEGAVVEGERFSV